MPDIVTNLGGQHSPKIGMYLAGSKPKEFQAAFQLVSSSFQLEAAIPHPEGDFLLLAHDRGFRLTSRYEALEFSSILPFDAVESIEAINRHQVKKKPDFSIPICLLAALVFYFFLEPATAIILAVMCTAIAGMLMPAEVVYRIIRIRLREQGQLYEFSARYPKRKTEEVHGFFLRHLPEKFYDPLASL